MKIKLSDPLGIAFVCSLFSAAFFVYKTIELNNIWDMKINEQRNIIYALTDASKTWDRLSTTRQVWADSFVLADDRDLSLVMLSSLLKVEISGLKPVKSRIQDSVTSPVLFNGVDLGLTRTCVKNTHQSFEVESDDINILIAGLRHLEERREISFSHVEILNKYGSPLARIYDLCVILRTV